MKIDKRQQRREAARLLQASRPKISEDELHAGRLRQHPLVKGWMQAGWEKTLVASCMLLRKRPDKGYAALLATVDLGCLGIIRHSMQAQANLGDLMAWMDRVAEGGWEEVGVGRVVQMMRVAMAWCVECGMPVREGQRVAAAFLGDAAGDPSFVVPRGRDGRPFLVPGPDDDAAELSRILVEKFGRGNVEFLMGLGSEEEVAAEDGEVLRKLTMGG